MTDNIENTMPTPAVGTVVSTTVKNWYGSSTVWIAIIQAVIGLLSGIVLLFQNGFTEQSIMALSVGLKGLIDIRQRFITTQPIK